MTQLSEGGREALAQIASRHDVSPDAVEHVLLALLAGQGTQAQFNHPDLGGMGQWSQGGMTMVGDMFNNALKARVDALCSEVAQLMQRSELLHRSEPLHRSSQGATQSQSQGEGTSLFVAGGASGNWWPSDLGHAASTGMQNQMRYAWFPDKARLAIDAGDGKVCIYDTGDHSIGGFSQQQSGDQSLSFTSQHGPVKLSELKEVPMGEEPDLQNGSAAKQGVQALSEALLKAAGSRTKPDQEPVSETVFAPTEPSKVSDPVQSSTDEADIFAKIERLAALHQKGILTDQEYQTKKAELLARI